MIDISCMRKAAVLAKLYNNARPLGMGFLHYTPGDMSIEEADAILDQTRMLYFDYLKGRVLKVNLAPDLLRTDLYDRDNGPGAAARALGLPEIGEVIDG